MAVMLGFGDQEINIHDPVDWSTNKIGGLPNWMDGIKIEYPQCKLCFKYLYHLVQIYCPLQNSKYHRTLNIFGCTNKKCWNQSESICVVRSQMLEEEIPKEEKKTIHQDDWGVNDWEADNMCDEAGFRISTSEKEYKQFDNALTEASTDTRMVAMQVDEPTVKDSNSEDLAHFLGYHVFVQSEETANSVKSAHYEMELYRDYVSREGKIDCTSSFSSKSKSNSDEPERYEKTQLKHGDKMFHQFKKRISNYSEQLIRYEWDGKPLILSNKSEIRPSLTSLPNCLCCQSPRVFELQLMPGLVDCLHKKKSSLSPCRNRNVLKNGRPNGAMENIPFDFNEDETVRIEFGCIYVYSCSKTCWDGSDIRFEHVTLQPDPDVDVLK